MVLKANALRFKKKAETSIPEIHITKALARGNAARWHG